MDAVGNTPVIYLSKMTSKQDADVIVKYEALNVGGSIKTRTALNMIVQAEKENLLHADSIIVEPTSGNQGIGLALVGAIKGYRTMIIMPDSVSRERRLLIEQYGAEVILVHDDGDIGACIQACLQTALDLQKKDKHVFIPQQFTNPNNPLVHEKQTAIEILNQVNIPIDGFCSGIGTGGTISGIGKILRAKYPDILIWAIEPDQAAVLSGGIVRTHNQMGIGDGFIPENLDTSIYDDTYIISDEEALQTAKDLAQKEGLLCGISSGTNVAAALKMAKILGKGKTVLTILPDTGERYFSTPLFE